MRKAYNRRAPYHDIRHFAGVVIMLAGALLCFFIGDRVFGFAPVLRYFVGELGWFVPGAMILLGASWAIIPSAGRMMGPLVCSCWTVLSIMSLYRRSGLIGHEVSEATKFVGPHFPQELGLFCLFMAFFHLRPAFTSSWFLARASMIGRNGIRLPKLRLPKISFKAKVAPKVAPVITRVSRPTQPASSSPSVVVPSFELLTPQATTTQTPPSWHATAIAKTFASHHVPVDVTHAKPGATVCLYGVKPQAAGTKISDLDSLRAEIALALKVPSVRIAPINGRIGVEVPNAERQTVGLREVLEGASKGSLNVAIGKDVSGKPVLLDLTTAPHLLVAGTTGSGKTSALHSLICSLFFSSPEKVRLVLIDPKLVEFGKYRGAKHLLTEVVTDMAQVLPCLDWLVQEMQRRYASMLEMGASTLDEMPKAKRPPYLVVVIDELNALNMSLGKSEVDQPLVPLLARGRGAGIHVVVATQYPTSEVVSNQIAVNVTTRLCFKVGHHAQSVTILGETGAEGLVGKGDGLFHNDGTTTRIQGCFVKANEKEALISHWGKSPLPKPPPSPMPLSSVVEESIIPEAPTIDVTPRESLSEREEDIQKSIAWLRDKQSVAASALAPYLKKRRAYVDELLQDLEKEGYVGPKIGTKPRVVLRQGAVT